MLAVNDLFYLAEPFVKSLFFEDVVAWMDESEVRYTPKVKFTGVSGYDHLFDFVIPKSRKGSGANSESHHPSEPRNSGNLHPRMD
jgi:hypothetical protein